MKILKTLLLGALLACGAVSASYNPNLIQSGAVVVTGGTINGLTALSSHAPAVIVIPNTDPTGATDSLSGMQAYVNANVFAFVSPGTYCFSAPLAPPANTTWWGIPGTVTIQPCVGNSSSVVLLGPSSGDYIYGITFNGGGANFANTGNVIQLFNTDAVTLDTITVQHTRGIAVLASTSVTHTTIKNSTFKDIGNHWKTTLNGADRAQAIAFCCGTSDNSFGNKVIGNYFTDIGLDGVQVYGVDSIVSHNTFEMFNNEHNLLTTNNSAMNGAIYVPPPSSGSPNSLTAVGNNITGPSGNCIDTIGGSNITITGNTIKNCGDAGIGIFTGDAVVTVNGNTVLDSGQWTSCNFCSAIALNGTTNNVTIDGNTAKDDQGSKTQKYGLKFSTSPGPTPVVSNALKLGAGNNFAGNKLAAFGGVYTGSASSAPADGPPSSDNFFLNPQFLIDQRNAGAAVTETGAIYGPDGWYATTGGLDNRLTFQPTTSSPPPGATRSEVLTVTSSTTPSAGNFLLFCQDIEGTKLTDLGWGSAGASDIVLSFWINSSLTGNISYFINNGPGANRYNVNVIPVSPTYSYVTETIAGDTSGTWSTGRASAMAVCFDLGSGSNFQSSTLSAWQGATAFEATGSLQLIANAAATLKISQMRLRKGDIDTPYQPRPYAEEFAAARRYVQTSIPDGTAMGQNKGLAGSICTKNPIALGDPSYFVQLSPEMMSTPTIVTYNPSVANANWRDVTAGSDAAVSVDPAAAVGATGVLLGTSGTVTTLGDILCIHYSAISQP